jgi:EAL domain-containing protein (putative c-di-GMP-specific phosphodiesterase class I)
LWPAAASGRTRSRASLTDVAYALRRSNLEPRCLLLEITENVLLTDVEEAVAWMSALKALGVRIAIDDLGTGYSSLAYLRQLPVDVVNVDRSFVAPAADRDES